MPNWCENRVRLTALRSEQDEISKLHAFLRERDGVDWFDYFVEKECESESERGSDVDNDDDDEDDLELTNIERWGCKWNCRAKSTQALDAVTLCIEFDSPWSPPIALYEHIQEGGVFEVLADWFDPAERYVGRYDAGHLEDYTFSDDAASLSALPPYIVETWNLLTPNTTCLK